MKAKEIKSSRIADILKETPLEIRLSVNNEMAFIELITKLGYRESKPWSDDENDILQKIWELALELTKNQVIEIEQWEKDGKPK